ncbi:Acidic phosphoprotein precursor PCEMA1, putative [Plasmodium chabaudi adami]|uniref:Acidic phosphoprotein PCEMA1, putative n=1 Tax=Plasmodium chabaudi adami TaxID=5826 RepID=A0A1C6WLA3_PLACE|nr:Acidic phosphoprotein precursor PCEMA1, putative [Plasmodium chabaudi adami]
MKATSLSLISSIVFSIALAKECSDSESTTCCFPSCRIKKKKFHKKIDAPVEIKDEYDPDIPNLKYIDKFSPITLDIYKGDKTKLNEPFVSETDGAIIDKVTGFLIRENDPRRQGCYIKPYEEKYEHMIKINFIPLKENCQTFQSNQITTHKQSDIPPPIPKVPGEPELSEEELSTISEEDSSTLHEDPKLDEYIELLLENEYEDENEETYQKNKHLLCTDPEETIKAKEYMKEAVKSFVHHATSEDDYKLCGDFPEIGIFHYKKKHEEHTDVEKIQYLVDDLDKYNEILNELWNPNHVTTYNYGSVKIVRVYNPNLVMIQQRYKKNPRGREKYFYALVKKTQISENKTIIVMASVNVNDHNRKNKKSYQNTIIENANIFKADVDSEDDIRKGKLKKTFINIAGCLIEKKDEYVDIIYLESINPYASNFLKRIIKKAIHHFFPHIYFSSPQC